MTAGQAGPRCVSWCAALESNQEPTDQETLTAASTKWLSHSVFRRLARHYVRRARVLRGTQGDAKERKTGPVVPFSWRPVLAWTRRFAAPRGRARKFGREGNFDHYGTQQCTTRTGMSSSSSTNLRLFQQSCGACPDMYPNFKRAR